MTISQAIATAAAEAARDKQAADVVVLDVAALLSDHRLLRDLLGVVRPGNSRR